MTEFVPDGEVLGIPRFLFTHAGSQWRLLLLRRGPWVCKVGAVGAAHFMYENLTEQIKFVEMVGAELAREILELAARNTTTVVDHGVDATEVNAVIETVAIHAVTIHAEQTERKLWPRKQSSSA